VNPCQTRKFSKYGKNWKEYTREITQDLTRLRIKKTITKQIDISTHNRIGIKISKTKVVSKDTVTTLKQSAL
jgi:hypothetical protein